MKKASLALLILLLILSLFACREESRVDLTERTFFYGMTTINMYPEEYYGKEISFDCFTYRLTDVDGVDYMCGVRKCSAGYGCKCGKDSVIGFILDYEGEIPEPKNQSADTADKTWIHVEGTLASKEAQEIKLYAFENDTVNYEKQETVLFCRLTVTSLTLIEDASGLAFYVTA